MSNRRGWRWRVLEAYPDARCGRGVHLWFVMIGSRMIGDGCTAPMAWRDAWIKIEAERGGK
jgi:hypothetical protein